MRPTNEDTTLPLPDGKGAGVEIEYSAELIDRIRAETVKSLLSIPYGGLEIAGLLLGTRKGRMAYLAETRPIECEHAGGPSLILSPHDERKLESLLAHSRHDPELEGLDVLGWYVSHTRRAPNLTPGEMELFERLFPGPQQFIGVVRPEATGAAQFHWFVRDADGSVDPVRASSEFTVQPRAGAPPASEAPQNARTVPFELPPGALMVPDPRAAAPSLFGRIRMSSLSLAAAGLLLLMIAVGMVWWFGVRPQAESAPPLHVRDTGTQLSIDWDAKSRVVQRAKSGALEIKDSTGHPERINLSRAMIRNGSVLYNKPSNKVEVVLQLRDEHDNVTTSMVYFIGREQVAAEVKQLPPVVVYEVPAEPLGKAEPPKKLEPITVAPSTGSAERARGRFRPPVAKSAAAQEPALLEPPKIATAPTPLQTQNGPPLLASVRPEAAPPPPVIPEAAKPKPQATSGRLIWTGDLHKNAVLHISEQGASAGSLNGKLPAQPVKVSARSAELMDGAIAIYTSDANANTKAEAPGRRNGWNVTMYKFDPKHAHDLAIVETPSESNNWKLGIKSVNRAITMIVIDWQAAGN